MIDDRRSRFLAGRIHRRTDVQTRKLIDSYKGDLDFEDKESLLISVEAWNYVVGANIEPRRVFAHPVMLRDLPRTSLYYRGLCLLSQKQVGQMATDVKAWEDGTRRTPVAVDKARRVCCVYNATISSIIEGTANWAIEDGYRNIVAAIGIGLDGSWRNNIGKDAENLVQTQIVDWLVSCELLEKQHKRTYWLSKGITMEFGSEPDILFRDSNRKCVATIEIKGGTDPAGALERLGAVRKSFAEMPPQCQRILVAGVVTEEMQHRLEQMAVQSFLLDDLLDAEGWRVFCEELFHYTLRIV